MLQAIHNCWRVEIGSLISDIRRWPQSKIATNRDSGL